METGFLSTDTPTGSSAESSMQPVSRVQASKKASIDQARLVPVADREAATRALAMIAARRMTALGLG